MIIWSGGGLIALLLAIGFQVLAYFSVNEYFGASGYYQEHVWPAMTGFWVAAVVLFFLRPLIGGKNRVLTDEATGEKVSLNREGSLFFIPTRYWPAILIVIGAVSPLFHHSN